MSSYPLLSIITFLPLLGAFFILFMKGREAALIHNAKLVALMTSLMTLLLTLFLWQQFDTQYTGYQFVETYAWLNPFQCSFTLGIDGISLPFIVLTGLLIPLCIVASWNSINTNVHGYLILFLVLETLVIGTFCALDLIVFYIFFESVLIPMYFIIGIWGGQRRIYASFKFFLYTLAGSLLMLVAIIAMTTQLGSSSMIPISGKSFSYNWQLWLWLAFFISFAVKMPMWPLHTWLPDAHVEAPTAGSVILAGVLLKMGGYGFLRFLLPMFPEASHFFAPLVQGLSVIAVIYTSLIAFVQEDIKKLIAYSSVAHMGFVTMGIFTFNHNGLQGAMAQMISHGIISSALFLCVGVIYDRMHTRQMSFYGGIAKRMPLYATFFLLFTMGSMALPGTSGFIAEFLVLLGSAQVSAWIAFLMATSMVLGAVYMLYMYRRVALGKIENPELNKMKDITWQEIGVLLPLALLTIWLGFYPGTLLKVTEPSLLKLQGYAPVNSYKISSLFLQKGK